MNNPLLVLVVIALIIGGAMYMDQIAAVFHGMSPLESLQFIVQFVLHVTVITIAVYVVQTLPEIVRPWIKMMKLKRRMIRRNRGMEEQKRAKTPRLNTDQMLRAYMIQQMSRNNHAERTQPPHQDEPTIRF